MGIAIKPVKLTRHEIEVDIDPSVPLRTGQILRLESDRPIYGRVCTIQTVDQGYRAGIHILYGEPHLGIHTAHMLDGTQLAAELQQLLGTVSEPLFLGDTFMGDLAKMGPLTVIDGDSLESRHQAAVEIMDGLRLHHRLLVIDPLGLFALAEGYHVAFAGQDVKLSLQDFGLSRFLSELSRIIPEAFHEEALQLLGQGIPMTLDFVPCKSLLSPKRYEDMPAKGPLLHLLYDIHRQGAFADEPEEVFALDTAIPDQMNVLELSNLQDPWRSVFYAHICEELVRHKVHDLIPVLIYPENYLQALDHWLTKLDEAEYKVLVLPSNAGRRQFEERAGNRFVAEHAIGSDEVYVHLSGEMTLGLTVTALLRGMEESEAELLEDLEELEMLEDSKIEAPPEAEEFAPFPEMGTALPEAPEPEEELELSIPPEFELTFDTEEQEPEPQDKPAPLKDEIPVPSYTPPTPPPPLGESRPVGDRGLREIPPQDLAEGVSDIPVEEYLEDEWDERIETPAPEDLAENPADQGEASAWPPEEPQAEIREPDLAFNEEVADLDFDFDPSLDTTESSPPPPPSEPEPRLEAGPEPGPETHPVSTMTGTLHQPEVSGHSLDDIYNATPDEPEFEFEFEPDYEPVSPVASETIETEPEPGAVGEYAPEPAPRTAAAPPPMPPMPTGNDGLSEVPVYQTVDPESQAIAEQAGYHPGDRVRHSKYGDGVVEKVIPMEERVTLKIIFESIGKRLLDAESAHLQKA